MDQPFSAGLPGWLAAESSRHGGVNAGRAGFLRRTLSAMVSVFDNEIYAERCAAKPGFLQQVDARVKLLTLLFFMLFAAFARGFLPLVLLGCTGAVYAGLSGVGLRAYLRRVWLVIPVMVFVFSLPAALRFGQGSVFVTRQGAVTALRLMLRSGDSLSMAYLLIVTTRWHVLVRALQSLRVPKAFCAVLAMAYRYVFLLCESALALMQARFLRTVGRTRTDRRFFGHGAAFLFVKTSLLSETVYDAMVCRGYTGKTMHLQSFRLTGVDILFLINNTIVILILFWGEHLF